MSKCNLVIKYKLGDKEQEFLIPTNFNEDQELSPSIVMEAISGLDIDEVNRLKVSLSELTPLNTTITYSNGEPLIGNATLTSIHDQIDYIQNEELKSGFLNLEKKLGDLGISSDEVQILLLEGENIVLNIEGHTDVRGALLNDKFIILNASEGFTEGTLRALYHELLHLYFNNRPKSDENFNRVNEIAYKVFEAAKKNTGNPTIKDFVTKVSNREGRYNLTEFIAYIVSDPKYREALNFDLSSGAGKEFITKLYMVDDNIGILANQVNVENIFGESEKRWDGKEPVFNEGTKTFETGIEDPSRVYWDPKDQRFELVPFVGKYDSEYIKSQIPKDVSQDWEKVSGLIWKEYIDSTTHEDPKQAKLKYSLNYSEPINLESPVQLYALTPGDLILLPQIRKNEGEVLYGEFNDTYFSSKQYLPIRSIWKNDNGEVLITALKNFGGNVSNVTISYTDLIRLTTEKGITPTIRKFYGKLQSLTIDPQTVKITRDQFEENLLSEDEESQPLLKKTGFNTSGRSFTYYVSGKGGFRLNTSEVTSNLLSQELRRGDIVKVKTPYKNKDGEWESFNYYAPVLRAYGTIVEVAGKSKDSYFTKQYPFRDVQEVIFNKENHPELVEIYNKFNDDYIEYRNNIRDKSKYQSLWFTLGGLVDDNQQRIILNGDFTDAIDPQGVITYRRENVKRLHIGDSISVEWPTKDRDGRSIISKHIVVAIDGDTIWFLNRNKANEGETPTTGVSRVDLKTKSPLTIREHGVTRHIPTLAAIHLDNSSDINLVNDLYLKKDAINKSFDKRSGEWVFNSDSESIKSLDDIYDIVNIDSSNAEEEASKLQRGDIIKFIEAGNDSYLNIGVVSKVDLINGVIEVPGYYRSGENVGNTYRKRIPISDIIYIGFATEPNIDLGVIGHPDIVQYNQKRVSRLYDMNHSTYGLSYKDILKKKDLYNKTTTWVTETEVKYIAPADSEISFIEKYKDSKEKGVKNGRMIVVTAKIQDLLKKGTYVDLTSEYIKANNINTPDGKLYGLKRVRYSNSTAYEFMVPNTTGLRHIQKLSTLQPRVIKSILQPQDVVKLQYASGGDTKYTKYLRVVNKTDKGIKLESEVVGLDGKVYSNKWYINFNDIDSGKYKFIEIYYPNSSLRTTNINSLIQSNTDKSLKSAKYFKPTTDKFDQKRILNRVISNINSNFNNIINVIDDDVIKEWVSGENPEVTPYIAQKLKHSGAFILGNKVYVNTDRASLSSPLHELLHIVMGVMKQTIPERYNVLINKVSELPGFTQKYREVLSHRTLSDAKEEAFVDAVAKALTGVFSSDGFDINSLLKGEDFFSDYLQILNTGLELNIGELGKDSSEVISKQLSSMTLEQIVMEFNSLLAKSANPKYSLFNVEGLNKAFRHRQIANIKSGLIKSGNLIENC